MRINHLLGRVLAMSLLTVFSIKTAVSQNLDTIKPELEHIYFTSLKLRISLNRLLSTGEFDSPRMDSLKHEILEFDSLSLITVTHIIETYGWLGISEIGEQANQAIYLTVQHADLDTQLYFFPMLQKSSRKGESPLSDMATMEDRILVRQGKNQKYGTQSKYIDGEKVMLPIEDEKNVNKLRRSVGLKRLKNTNSSNG